VSTAEAKRCHVRVRCAPGSGDALERLDPSRLAAFPATGGAARDAFVAAHAPKVTIVAPFDAARGDDPANFLRFTPPPRAANGEPGGVDPNASCVVRFSAPMDPATLGNLRVFAGDETHQVAVRIFPIDRECHAVRVAAPLGWCLTPAIKAAIVANRDKPVAERQPSYVLHVGGGERGLRSRSGMPLAETLRAGFVLDPEADDNIVTTHFWILPDEE
jgi:hypothetical protein